MSYFESHKSNLIEKKDDVGLLEWQIGASWAVQSHFTSYDDRPAIVSAPPGTGKAVLMMLLSFELEAERVLIVAPSSAARVQIAENFRHLDLLIGANVLNQPEKHPDVATITERVTSERTWYDLGKNDVIVALPHNISTVYSGNKKIVPPPADFFDVVFFSLGQTARTAGFQDLIETMNSEKNIIFSSSPFKRDRQSLPGKVAYHYPIAQALEKGLYEPVEFLPVESPPEASLDQALCRRAKEKIESIHENDNRSAQILVKTTRIDHANSLKSLYRKWGLEVEAVHSERSSVQNESTWWRLQNQEIDGIIIVGKSLDELNPGNIKIAVLHRPSRSFPFVVQLIGRIARLRDNFPGSVIADPAMLRERGIADSVIRLYREEQGWGKLIPGLIEQFAELEPRTAEAKTVFKQEDELRPNQLSYYFTLLRIVYIYLYENQHLIDNTRDIDITEWPQKSQEIREDLLPLSVPQKYREEDLINKSDLEENDLYIEEIQKQSPLEIWFSGLTTLLVIAFIINGGELEIQTAPPLIKIDMPPLGQGIEKLKAAIDDKDTVNEEDR